MDLGLTNSARHVKPSPLFKRSLRLHAAGYTQVLETLEEPWIDIVCDGKQYVFRRTMQLPTKMWCTTIGWWTNLTTKSHKTCDLTCQNHSQLTIICGALLIGNLINVPRIRMLEISHYASHVQHQYGTFMSTIPISYRGPQLRLKTDL